MNFLNDITVSNNITAIGTIQSANLTLTGISTGAYSSVLVENAGIVYKRDLTLSLLPTGTEGQLLYNNAGTWTAFSGVFWDDTNNCLGIGVTASLGAKLNVRGTGTTSSTFGLEIEDSAGKEIFRVRDDGLVAIRQRVPDAVYGAELITNGAFTWDISGWTIGAAGTDWSWSAGVAAHAATAGNTFSQGSATASAHYRVKVDVTKSSGTNIALSFGGTTFLTVTANGTSSYTYDVLTTNTSGFVATPTADFVGSIDNVSVTAYSGPANSSLIFYGTDGSTIAGEMHFGNVSNNIGIGTNALLKVDGVVSVNNVAIGYSAMQNSYYAGTNTAIGSYAGQNLNNAFSNTLIGYVAGGNMVAGTSNTAIGHASQYISTNPSGNSSLGYNSLRNVGSANYNTAIGYSSLLNTTGDNTTAIGAFTGQNNTTGTGHTLVGYGAGFNLVSGSYNVAMGYLALYYANAASSYNIAIGGLALIGNSSGNAFSNNVVIGYNSANVNTTGSNNVFIGYSTGVSNTSGSNNVLLGYNIDVQSGSGTGQLSIANALFGTGNTATGTSVSSGKLGVFVAAPSARLHLVGGGTAASSAALKFTSGSTLTAAEAGAVEWDGTNLYITQTSGPTRKTIAYTDSVSNVTVTNDTTTNATMYPLWVTASSGNLPVKVSSTKMTFNPSTGTLASVVLQSTVATGTAPMTVVSTTVATNLNADLLDGQHGSYYLDTSSGTQSKTGNLTLSGTTTLSGVTIISGELASIDACAQVHDGNVEKYYQMSRRLQAFSHQGNTTVMEIEAFSFNGGYSGQVQRTIWTISTRGAIYVTRQDQNGGVANCTLKIIDDTTVTDTNGNNAKYYVGLVCGNAANYNMIYMRARFVETDSSSRWMTVAEMATATPTTVGGSAMTYSSGWVANGGTLTVMSFTENIISLKASQFTSTVTTGTAPLVVSSTTAVVNLQSQYATNLYAGATGGLPYQSAANTTAFLSLGTTNYVLTAGASAPQWVAQSTLTVGSATSATNATNTAVTDDTATNATMYPTWVTATTGNLPQKVSSTKFTFNPSTGNVDCYGIYTSGHAIALYAGSYQINVTSGMTHTGIYTNNIGGKAVEFTHATSNWIQWGTGGLGAPTFTTSSVGTKLMLYPMVGASNADYAIGMESGAMWFGITTTANSFKWYGGTTNMMQLTNSVLTVGGNTVLHAGNYNTYAPTLTGTGASGTWGISISGAAASATSATNATNIGITDDTTSNATMYPAWVTTTSGNLPAKISSSKLTFNPSAGRLATTDYVIGPANDVIGTTISNSDYGGPKSLVELAMILGSAIGVADPFRYKVPITKEYWNGTAWTTDSSTDWSGALAPGYFAPANVITNAEYVAGTTKKRIVIDTSGSYVRPNMIIVQRGWNGSDVPGTVDIESSVDNSVWVSKVTGQVLGGAVYFAQNDAGQPRYWRFTITCTGSPGTGNTLSIRRIMALSPVYSGYSTFPIYISASGAVTISGTLTATVTNVTGGATGSLLYQSAASTTTTLALGTTNYVLTAGASAPQWVAQSTLTVGSATSATNATNMAVTDDTTTNATMYPTWVTANTGNLPQKVTSTKLTFNPSTGTLTATAFSGSLTGNVTGNCTGSSGSCTGNAASATYASNATIVDDTTTNANVYLAWVTSNTGNLPIKVCSTKLYFNPSSGFLVAGQISSNGGAGGYIITRRDTSAAAWQWYSAAGTLALYDHVGAADKLTWTQAGTLTIAAASVVLNGASGLSVTGGASTLKAAAYGSAAGFFAVFPADPSTTAQTLQTRTAAQVRSDISAATSGAITGSGLTMSTARMLGRTTAATGAIEEITVGTGLALASTTLSTSGAYTANGYTMSTARLLGRTTASSGAAEEISLANGTNCSATLSAGVLTIAISSTPTFTDCTVTGRMNLPTSQPASPVNGSCYWDGSTNKFWVYSSTYGWKSVTLT